MPHSRSQLVQLDSLSGVRPFEDARYQVRKPGVRMNDLMKSRGLSPDIVVITAEGQKPMRIDMHAANQVSLLKRNDQGQLVVRTLHDEGEVLRQDATVRNVVRLEARTAPGTHSGD
jgi:hypothetical protein